MFENELAELKRLYKCGPEHKWKVGDDPSQVIDECPCCGLVATCSQFGPGDSPEHNYATSLIVAMNNALPALLERVETLEAVVHTCPTCGEMCKECRCRDAQEALMMQERASLREACLATLEALRSCPMMHGDYQLDPIVMSDLGKRLRAALVTPTQQSNPVPVPDVPST
jgi:hypothetical protein